ncbi:hypothetical protein B0O99DRAFT_655664 [Bisporella sp. PMI_857]|nr:hypothetical protein B0O99DRAFT_655664 [Bisporella sp. PMI_857]
MQTRTDEDPSQSQTSPILASFFRLPGDIRNNIYRRALVAAHPLYLFQDTGSQVVEAFAPDRPLRWLALLYTNRQIHGEASAVLYGVNYFTFLDTTQHQCGHIRSFLNCIGLKLLQEKCANLTTLETLIHSQNSRRPINPSHDDSQFIQEVLSQTDAQLKAISSLNKIIVRSYNGTLAPSVIELMQRLGWVILPGR